MIRLQEFTGVWAVFRQSGWGGENQICPVSTLGPPALKPSIAPLTQGERRTDLQAPATLCSVHIFSRRPSWTCTQEPYLWGSTL